MHWDGGKSDNDELTDDLCVWTDDAGEPAFFIRGLLTIPVLDADDDFRFGVWSSLSGASFERIVELWDDPARIEEDPYFGWLSNSIPGYPDTVSLPLSVITGSLELRPSFLLHDGDHPLIREQREGITAAAFASSRSSTCTRPKRRAASCRARRAGRRDRRWTPSRPSRTAPGCRCAARRRR